MVWFTGNNSLDPCAEFFAYTCHHYRPEHVPNKIFGEIVEARAAPTAVSNNQAGRLLMLYYKSCLRAQLMKEKAGREAVQAFLETTQVGRRLSDDGLFRLIISNTLTCGMHSYVIIVQRGYGKFPSNLPVSLNSFTWAPKGDPQQLLIVASQPVLSSQQVTLGGKKYHHFSEALDEYNEAMKMNITLGELSEFAMRLQEEDSDQQYYNSTLRVLDVIVPRVSAEMWQNIIENTTGIALSDMVTHSSIERLRHRFSLLLDPAELQVSLAFVIIEASLVLLLDHLEDSDWTRGTYAFCKKEAMELEPVWVLDEVLRVSAEGKYDREILSVFDSVVNATIREVKQSLEELESAEIEKRLLALQLLFPHDVVPFDTKLPELVERQFSPRSASQKASTSSVKKVCVYSVAPPCRKRHRAVGHRHCLKHRGFQTASSFTGRHPDRRLRSLQLSIVHHPASPIQSATRVETLHRRNMSRVVSAASTSGTLDKSSVPFLEERPAQITSAVPRALLVSSPCPSPCKSQHPKLSKPDMRCLLLCMALFVVSTTGDEISDVRVEVGRALKTMGEWLQNEGAPGTDDERAALQDALRKIAAVQANDADLEGVDPYIWDKLGEVATSIAKKAVVAFVTQQVVGLIGGSTGLNPPK
ncbi:hypothetical protein MTO96_030286 [Rhipicephalus appendiculatus]